MRTRQTTVPFSLVAIVVVVLSLVTGGVATSVQSFKQQTIRIFDGQAYEMHPVRLASVEDVPKARPMRVRTN